MPAPVEDRVAVVTVSYNSSRQLPEFLGSIRALDVPPAHTLIVDNASRDLDETRAAAAANGASLVELDRNLGYGGAVNAGVRGLPADIAYVLISNPDVALEPDALSTMLGVLEADERIGAVGPRILNEDGTVYPSARGIPSIRTGVGHALLVRSWPSNPWTRTYRGEREEGRRAAGWLSGSCLLVRRSAFEEVGGFDEAYFMYFEDVDLGYRLGRRGWTNLYEPSATVTHIGGLSTRAESTRMLQAHHESAIRFIGRKYSSWPFAPVRWALTVGLRTRFAIESWRAERASRRAAD
ncbi:glycosyltransferase family 2 protein [Agromyces protaetiae]|uniref:Glycosyltransferase family 2 protein n=1 Tax=Agromyces protaetiae TaxID=2509455 RepID=A0A4P6FEJ3_9MICO|nr:glycosyltransferase family 2 protein [Agromyces protaetiae]QAY74592.1 glycosyltransferase family 2 protein [Agromyces protaetiae]